MHWREMVLRKNWSDASNFGEAINDEIHKSELKTSIKYILRR